ncbi:tectonin beta-propeller repeat-containing protein 2-like isoform X2 [Portunus trituberculatus]|uniref:tectonin beta-propeller repeat-containing protein 2-like isoform X2 n=1 Tax=Portunus trituberculatus TaxID=210409 RepID=UPI001E1D0A6E|nr:tectonin beta-propeller repeat-containing protein 2-like isoform X2 [Portunus trituberculatus]
MTTTTTTTATTTTTTAMARWDEWVPLSPLLDQLPDHFQRGLSTSELHLTSLAALPDNLVMGTNVGLVYLAHLPSLNLMRLKCENAAEGVSCVAGVRTVEDMIAAGGTDGTITVFQLPRIHSPNPSTKRDRGAGGDNPPTYPPIKRFTITTTHSARITALTWSLNGLLLFSGDCLGVVGLVEVQPNHCQCTARHLITEPSPVVQLSYLHQRLAVCTLERALIYHIATGECVQVGRKARKQPGVFGCVWAGSATRNTDLLYTSRPGLRLWAAEGSGEVSHTHIIRDLPQERETRLLNPYAEAKREGEYFSFGLLHLLGSHALVSHTRQWLVAFDTSQQRILSYSGRFRSINAVAVSENRIFVLEGSRTLLCLTTHPPSDIGACRQQRSPSQALHDLSVLGSKLVMKGNGFFDQLAKVGSSVAAKVTEHAAPAVMTGHKGGGGGGGEGGGGGRGEGGGSGKKVEGCVDSLSHSSPLPLPPAMSSSSSSSSSSLSSASSPAVVDSDVISVVEVEEAGGDGGDNWGPLIMPVRVKRKKKKNATPPDTPKAQHSSPLAPSTPLSSEDTPGDIHTNIQEKESLLASILDMDCLKLDHPSEEPVSPTPGTPQGSEMTLGEVMEGSGVWEAPGSPEGTQCSTPSTVKELSPAPCSLTGADDFYARHYQRYLSLSSVESVDASSTSLEHGGTVEEQQEEDDDLERIPSNFSEDRSSCLSYGPPSGSSLTVQPPAPPLPHPQPPRPCQGQVVTLNDSNDIADITWSYAQDEEEEEEEMSGGWVRRGVPGRVFSMAVSSTCRALVNTSGHLYLAGPDPKDPWRKVTLTRDAFQVSLGPQGDVGWVVVAGGEAYAFLPPPCDVTPPAPPTKMAAVCKDVSQASVAGEYTWFVDEDLQVCVCRSISEEAGVVQVSGGCGGAGVVRVTARGRVVWALTSAGQLLVRVGITTTTTAATSTIAVGQEWRAVVGPASPDGPSRVAGMALGPGSGWVVDTAGRLFFREGVCDAFPQGADLKWWQVLTSKYMVGEEVEVGGVLLSASQHGLWLAELNSQTCCVHRPVVRGHWWEVCGEEVWAAVCAEGLYTTQGTLCCLSPLGQLFLINPNTASCVVRRRRGH